MEVFGFAITFLSIVLTVMSWKNGKWMKNALNIIHEDGEKRQQGLIEWFKKADEKSDRIYEVSEKRHLDMVEWFKKTDERDEIRHREIAELLKKGFGDVSNEIRKHSETLPDK